MVKQSLKPSWKIWGFGSDGYPRRCSHRHATINSDNVDDWTKVEAKFARGEVDILLISPKRLATEHFRTKFLAGIAARIYRALQFHPNGQ